MSNELNTEEITETNNVDNVENNVENNVQTLEYRPDIHNIQDIEQPIVEQVEEGNVQTEETIETEKKGDDIMAEFQSFKEHLVQEINSLKEQVVQQKEQFNNAVEQKIQDIEKEKELESFLSEKAFVNDFTKQAIKQQVKSALGQEEHKNKDINTLYAELTDGLNNIYQNPNPVIIQQSGQVDGDALNIYEQQRSIYKALGANF